MNRKTFIRHLFLLSLVVIIMLTGVSYSWMGSLGEKQGNRLKWSDSAQIKSTDCTYQTYAGTVSHMGQAEYEAAPIGSSYQSQPASHAQGKEMFKTVITNNSSLPTNVSLYFDKLQCDSNATVNAFSPEKVSLNLTSGSLSYVAFMTNIRVDGNSEVSVEWYIEAPEGGDPTVTIENPRVIYN